MPPPALSSQLESIDYLRLPEPKTDKSQEPPPLCCALEIEYPPTNPAGTITSITPRHLNPTPTSTLPPLALPPLTHPHIHLDKAFLHSSPEYAHLLPQTGSFQEALSFTTEAKARFHRTDLLRRGEWLLAESVASGVTAMRAFVEVDHTVKHICLEAAATLKEEWKESCAVQIACFAQDPLFSSEFGPANLDLMEGALRTYSSQVIDVIATTPYVEADVEAAKRNIEWAVSKALELDKHLDFHIDYNIDAGRETLVWFVLRVLRERGWTSRTTSKRVMFGHCTRLTLFTDAEWRRLASEIREFDLPVSFVGLPTSDLYMAAPPSNADDSPPHHRLRGTLQVLSMIHDYGLDAVVGVNNVGNAFTPWGSLDPLSLACLGVGVYQARTQADAELLYECVSTRARKAIGMDSSGSGLVVKEGDRADLLLIHVRDDTGCGILRPRWSVAEVVWDPPARACREVVTGGRSKSLPVIQQ